MKEIEELLNKELGSMQQFALDEILTGTKDPRDNNFIARCWFRGLLRALKKAGYTICLKKDDLEIGF